MRLFLALGLPPGAISLATVAQQTLQASFESQPSVRLSCVPLSSNAHITLTFLGECDEGTEVALRDSVKDALRVLSFKRAPILTLRNELQTFGKPPSVVHMPFYVRRDTYRVHGAVKNAALACCPHARRFARARFVPHVTIARVGKMEENNVDEFRSILRDVNQCIADGHSGNTVRVFADHITLYLSTKDQDTNRMRYDALWTLPVVENDEQGITESAAA